MCLWKADLGQLQTVIEVILKEGALCLLQGLFHRMHLLRDIREGSTRPGHGENAANVAFSPFEPSDNVA